MKNKCKNISSLISYLIDDEPIPHKIRLQMETHLNHCKNCQQEVARLKQANDSLKEMMQTKLKRHISTNRLGHYIDNQVKFSIEKLEIESHLNKCKTCQQAVRQLQLLNEEWSDYSEKILPFPTSNHRIKKIISKLSDIFESIKKAIQTGLNNQWIQVSLATGSVAVIIFFMVKNFQAPVDEKKPFQDDVLVEEKDSIKTAVPEQFVEEKIKTDEVKKPENIIEKKAPDNWDKIKQAFAENFKPAPYLEEMLAYETRSYSINVLTPKIGEKFTGAILFQWEKIAEEPIYLKILNNRGFELFSYSPDGFTFLFTEKLDAGLYYWKLESEDDVLYVGKFLFGE